MRASLSPHHKFSSISWLQGQVSLESQTGPQMNLSWGNWLIGNCKLWCPGEAKSCRLILLPHPIFYTTSPLHTAPLPNSTSLHFLVVSASYLCSTSGYRTGLFWLTEQLPRRSPIVGNYLESFKTTAIYEGSGEAKLWQFVVLYYFVGFTLRGSQNTSRLEGQGSLEQRIKFPYYSPYKQLAGIKNHCRL